MIDMDEGQNDLAIELGSDDIFQGSFTDHDNEHVVRGP